MILKNHLEKPSSFLRILPPIYRQSSLPGIHIYIISYIKSMVWKTYFHLTYPFNIQHSMKMKLTYNQIF